MAVSSSVQPSPDIQQYNRFKARHPECLLLFLVGDFYEAFADDAVKLSKTLGMTLMTRSSDGVALCGFVKGTIDRHLKTLVSKGHRVAICEQIK